MSKDLVRARVLLTGATGGLGRPIALALAGRGADLVLSGRRPEQLRALAAQTGGRAVVADLADRRQVDRLVEEAGRLDVLVANAGLPASGLLVDYDPEEIDRALEVNLRAPVALTRALLPAMLAQGGGHLIFVSSLSGLVASPGTSLYSATKFGLRGFALGLRQDLAATGIGVSVVAPGFVRDAGMFADSGATLPAGVGTSTPEEVATAVLDALDHNRAEVLVGPRPLRVGTRIATVSPALSAWFQHRRHAATTAQRIAEGQREKR